MLAKLQTGHTLSTQENLANFDLTLLSVSVSDILMRRLKNSQLQKKKDLST